MRSKNRFAVATSLVALSFGWSVSAFAQGAAADADKSDSDAGKEIVVTGSLIQRPNNTAVSPIVTLGETAIQQSGKANLADATVLTTLFNAYGVAGARSPLASNLGFNTAGHPALEGPDHLRLSL